MFFCYSVIFLLIFKRCKPYPLTNLSYVNILVLCIFDKINKDHQKRDQSMKLKFPKNFHKTVLLQLILYFILITSITLCASSYFTYRYFSSFFRTENQHMNQKVLNQLSIFSDDFILKNINELILNLILNNSNDNSIKEYLNSTSYDSECLLNINSQLNDLVFQNRDIVDSILVYSKDSRLLAGTKFIKYIDPQTDGKSLEFSWINTFLDSGKTLLWLKTRNTIVYSDSTKNRGNVITVICSYPLSSKGKDVKGCIAMNIKEQALNEFLVRFNSLNSGHLMIMDNTGAIISSSEQSKLYEDISHEEFVGSILKSKGPGNLLSEYDGKEYVISYTPSSFNNWVYISMVPSELFSQQDYIVKKNIILISILILLIVFVLSNVFSYKLYIPLRKVIDRYIPVSYGATGSGAKQNEYKLLDNLFSNMSNKINDLQGTLERNSMLIKHNFLMGLLTKHDAIPFSDEKSLKFLNMPFKKRYFLVLILDMGKKVLADTQSGTLLFYKYKLIDFINAMKLNGIVLQPVDTDMSTVSVIVNMDSDRRDEVEGFLSEIQDFCLQNFSFHPIVGAGRFYDDIASISKSRIEARISVQYRFIYPEQSIFFYQDVPDAASDTTILQDFSNKVDKCLKLEDINRLMETLLGLPLLLIEKRIPYTQAKKETLALTELFRAYLSDKKITLEDISTAASWDKLRNSANIYEFIETFLGYSRIVYNHLSDKKLRKNSDLVKSIKQYITDHLHMDISLNSTADAFYISPFYLSKIFKEETSFNYIDFVMECKMNKAKELLTTTNMGIGNITASVGYSQTSYFSRRFKEYTGMTPNEYRREIHAKGSSRES